MARKFSITAVIAVMLGNGGAIAEDRDPGFIFMQKDEVALERSSGPFDVRSRVLVGNPDEEGIYVMRIEFGSGVTSPPHYHDQDRFITVISGVWGFGRGASGECGETVPMTEGAFVFHPRGAVHYDGSCNGEPVTVQIIGMGPVKTTWLESGE